MGNVKGPLLLGARERDKTESQFRNIYGSEQKAVRCKSCDEICMLSHGKGPLAVLLLFMYCTIKKDSRAQSAQ